MPESPAVAQSRNRSYSLDRVIEEYLEASSRLAQRNAQHPVCRRFQDASGCVQSRDTLIPSSLLEPERLHYLSLY